jgi:fucose 4-O-acetylase-like acetyltransferase
VNGKRIAFIDIARGFAIFSVIVVHTGFLPLQHQLLPLITPWMLPVFAVLHGWLSKDTQSFGEIIIRRFQSLIVPYAIYGGFTYVLWLGLRWYAVDSVLFASWDIALRQLFMGTSLVFNGPLWFLPAFYVASIIFEGSKQMIVKGNIASALSLAVLLAFIAFVINPTKSQVIFSYDLSLLLAAFMFVGMCMRVLRWKMVKHSVWWIIAVSFVLLSINNGTIDMFGRQFGTPWLYVFSACVGSGLVIYIAQYISEKKWWFADWWATVGKYSLVLLVTHWPIMQWLTFLLSLLGLLGALGGTPTYSSFSYYQPSVVVFTLIELPLLVLYIVIPLLVLPVVQRLNRAYLE